MTGQWTGGSANRMWHRGHQHTGDETSEVRQVLAEFRRQHGWRRGWVWDPYREGCRYIDGMFWIPG